ncbi:AraC family transcriptional regulator [Paenibacillus sp.]|uniref:AraC family transcriptional regulator n=1 Tax=Paenibacillus sp. TaxID=58172 RepID=UPI002D308854|nr:AraC family transcriptional regulator [Paenibacillus sp.]HZG87752.1 AraC family transcriptional regulator [Paenibacillus sp.]
MVSVAGAHLWVDALEITCYSARRYRLDGGWAIPERKLKHAVLWHVIGGSFAFAVNGETRRAERGQLVCLPANARISSRAIADDIDILSVNFDVRLPYAASLPWLELVRFPHCQSALPFRARLAELAETADATSALAPMKRQALLTLLLAEWIELSLVAGAAAEGNAPYADARLARLAETIALQPRRLPTVRELGEWVGLSEAQLRKLFRKHTGMSPLQYVHSVKIHQSKQLLLRRADRVSEIAAQLGFEDANYFARLFKKATGVSPSEFRETAEDWMT